jgi:hypothetical protein
LRGSTNLNELTVYFIPVIDESDGRLIYMAEPLMKLQAVERVIIVTPYEFSIILEEEVRNSEDASRIVKLTFWDLLETFEALKSASTFIVYHDSELDQIGKQLDAYSNQFWGARADNILDTIFLSREIYRWLETEIAKARDLKIYEECLKFHKKNGLVEIDEEDDLQKPFFERGVFMRRRNFEKTQRVRDTISTVAERYEEEAYLHADQFWDNLRREGKLIYYPLGEYPLI